MATTATRDREVAAAHTAAVRAQVPVAAANPTQAKAGSVASRALSVSRSRREDPAPTTGSRVASPIPPPSGGSLRQRFQVHPCASLKLHTKDVANITGNIGPASRPTPLSLSCRSLTTVAPDTPSRGDSTGRRQDPRPPSAAGKPRPATPKLIRPTTSGRWALCPVATRRVRIVTNCEYDCYKRVWAATIPAPRPARTRRIDYNPVTF